MMRRLEALVPPPLAALIVAAAMWGLAHASPTDISRYARLALAMAFSVPGVAVAIAGFLTFRRLGANIDPHNIQKGEVLVTSGVFRFTRNPMYLGMALVLTAYAVYLARPLAWLGPLAFVLYITRFQIFPE